MDPVPGHPPSGRRWAPGDLTAVATEVERRIGPDLLFIDDLQWADDDTRDVRTLLAGRVGIVATIRTGDAGAAAALELIGDVGGETLELGGLSVDASAEIVRRARPSIDPAWSTVSWPRLAATHCSWKSWRPGAGRRPPSAVPWLAGSTP